MGNHRLIIDLKGWEKIGRTNGMKKSESKSQFITVSVSPLHSTHHSADEAERLLLHRESHAVELL